MTNDIGNRDRAATTAEPTLDDLRSEFPIFESKIYMNSNSLGALSRNSLRQRREYECQWNELGASAWYELWANKLEEVRASFGRTVGAAPRDIALMPSVSAGLAAVAGALDFRQRNKVVLTSLDFPTLAHQFLSRRRTGLAVEIVESPDGIEVPLEAIEAAVDERTALVATSHVFFTTGAIQNASAIAAIAHRAGALFLLDAYQSNGQLPIDVREYDVDFLVSGGLKWLLGGPGIAFLYVRPEIDLPPTTLSWFGVQNQFGFDLRGAIPREDARRFELGTPAVGAAFTAAGGLEVIESAGLERIRERDSMLAEDLIERLRTAGFRLNCAPDPVRRSALVLARHPEAASVVRKLAERDIIVDFRADYVRFSPHFYNSIGDNIAVVDALAEEVGNPS
ncbi:MAG: aminotransferase class V-fold PLP-dependent enzyme [Gemmatimonadota bacterium]